MQEKLENTNITESLKIGRFRIQDSVFICDEQDNDMRKRKKKIILSYRSKVRFYVLKKPNFLPFFILFFLEKRRVQEKKS